MTNERTVIFKSTLDPATSPYTIGNSNARVVHVAPQNVPTVAIITEDGMQKRIRYIQGVDTIYEEEQIKRGYPREYDNKRTKITMINGEIRLYPSRDKILIEYLKKCPYNRSSQYTTPSNGHIFFEVDIQKKAIEEVAKFDVVAEAFAIINDIKNDRNKVYTLGKVFNMSEANTVEEILAHLGKIAVHSPKELLSAFNSQKIGTAKLVEDARRYNIITKTAAGWALTESNTKLVGFKIGANESTSVAKLVQYLDSQEGELHLIQLKELVDNTQAVEIGKLVIS